MLSFTDARTRLLAAATPVSGSAQLQLTDALGRILALPLTAPADVPAFANSAMDGYAVRSTDLVTGHATLRRAGTSLAGRPWEGTVKTGECVRIFTGAAMPDGADAVVIQENASEVTDEHVTLAADAAPGRWVRPAGHDFSAGQRLADAGCVLGPFHVALLAAAGISMVEVVRRLRVAVLANGDELREPGTSLARGQIYNSNAYMLRALLARLPVDLVAEEIVPDDPTAIDQALRTAASAADVVITCGGASVGDADHMHSALQRLGTVDFWRMAVRPGKPLIFGHIGAAAYVGLPGNPVSSAVTFVKLVAPFLRACAGAPDLMPLQVSARLTHTLERNTTRTDFQRGRLEQRDDGVWVTAVTNQSSGRISSLTDANCLLVLTGEERVLPAGESVPVEIYPELAVF